MGLKPKKLRHTRKILNLTDTRPLYYMGNKAAIVNIPKYFVRTLGWTPGRTTLTVTLNNDGSLNLRALPSKKLPKGGTDLPLFAPSQAKT